MNDSIPTAFAAGIIAIIYLAISLLVLVAMHVMRRNGKATAKTKSDKHSRQRIVYAIALAINIASLAVIVIMAFVYSQGAQRGMTMDDWKTMSLGEVIAANEKTPVSQTLPNDRNGDIVILYKYDCPDCEAIYDRLNDAIRDTGAKDVYFIASSSETGRELIKEGDIVEAFTMEQIQV